jgi:hypothetical protein
VYMREGTASRVMTADRPYGEVYGFYSVSPEYLGYSLVSLWSSACLTLRSLTVHCQLYCDP